MGQNQVGARGKAWLLALILAVGMGACGGTVEGADPAHDYGAGVDEAGGRTATDTGGAAGHAVPPNTNTGSMAGAPGHVDGGGYTCPLQRPANGSYCPIVAGHENYRCDYGDPLDACNFSWGYCQQGRWSFAAYAVNCPPRGEGGSTGLPDGDGGCGGPNEAGAGGAGEAGAHVN